LLSAHKEAPFKKGYHTLGVLSIAFGGIFKKSKNGAWRRFKLRSPSFSSSALSTLQKPPLIFPMVK
jgi:hypothetical protein